MKQDRIKRGGMNKKDGMEVKNVNKRMGKGQNKRREGERTGERERAGEGENSGVREREA